MCERPYFFSPIAKRLRQAASNLSKSNKSTLVTRIKVPFSLLQEPVNRLTFSSVSAAVRCRPPLMGAYIAFTFR